MNSKIALSGNLNFLSIGDVIQVIGSSGGSGTLRVISKYAPEPGFIYFSKGNIVDGTTPEAEGLDAVYALFGWMEGEFEFSEGSVNMPSKINASRMEIILDGLRKVDDGQTPKLGPVSYAKETGKDRKLPLIRGPLVDYIYVLDEETFPKGYKIAQEKKHGNWLWVVLEGTVNIEKETPKGPLTILKLGPGAYIGSLASFLFQENIRQATAAAETDVQLGVLDNQRLAEEFSGLSQDFKKFVLSIDRRLNEVTDRTVEAYLGADTLKRYTRNKGLFLHQGKKDDNLYKINRGEVCIIRKTPFGHLPLALLHRGDFIGHVDFLDIGHEPNHAAVFASKDLDVSAYSHRAFEEEYNQLSTAFRNLIESVATCTSITTRIALDFHKKHKKSIK